jgi:hypothetical protein
MYLQLALCGYRARVWSVKTSVLGLAIVFVAAGALVAAGHEGIATAVAVGGAAVVFFWRKALGKLGVRSSR